MAANQHSWEAKRDITASIFKNEISAKDASQKHGIGMLSLKCWVDVYQREGEMGLKKFFEGNLDSYEPSHPILDESTHFQRDIPLPIAGLALPFGMYILAGLLSIVIASLFFTAVSPNNITDTLRTSLIFCSFGAIGASFLGSVLMAVRSEIARPFGAILAMIAAWFLYVLSMIITSGKEQDNLSMIILVGLFIASFLIPILFKTLTVSDYYLHAMSRQLLLGSVIFWLGMFVQHFLRRPFIGPPNTLSMWLGIGLLIILIVTTARFIYLLLILFRRSLLT